MSVDFLKLRGESSARINRKFFQHQNEVENNRDEETDAIMSLQRLWRGYNARRYIAFLNKEATHIERTWRGYVGRQRAHDTRRAQVLAAETRYFDAMAVLIQKVFRGYRSRKRRQDFYARKRYVASVTMNSHQLKGHIEDNLAAEARRKEEEKQEADAAEFALLTENIHHLLSTASQPGVFQSPFGPEFASTAYGIEMESHIRDAWENRALAQKQERKRAKEEQGDVLKTIKQTPGAVRPKARGKGRGMGMPTPETRSSDLPLHHHTNVAQTMQAPRLQQGTYRPMQQVGQ